LLWHAQHTKPLDNWLPDEFVEALENITENVLVFDGVEATLPRFDWLIP
jgi:hypothetical protein